MAASPPAGLEWAASPPPRLAALHIVARKDGARLWSADLTGRATATFGRNSAASDFALDHASLSRLHAAVARDAAGQCFIVDLGSTHGTFVAGERLAPFQRRLVEPGGGDDITFGASTRRYALVTALDGGGGEAGEGASSSSFLMLPPPPRTIAPATAAPAAAAVAAEDDDDVAAGLQRAAGRRQREEDLRAAIASMSAPIAAIRHPGVGPAAAASATATTASFVAADDFDGPGFEEEGAEGGSGDSTDEQRAMAAAMANHDGALPLAFGAARPLHGVKRSRPVEDGDAGAGAGTGAGAGGAPWRRGGGSGMDGAASEGEAGVDDEGAGDVKGEDEDDEEKERHGEGEGAGRRGPSWAAARLQLPISHEVALQGHSKAVSALALDKGGARLLTGSSDNSVRLYDFGAMDATHRAFRELVPQEGQGVRSVAYSHNGDRFVVATGSAQARVFDRDARPLLATVKGDPYILDAANTRGHTASLSYAQFHPLFRDTLVTASLDGTVRLWDLVAGKRAFDELQCGDVLRFKSAKGQRAGVTAAAVTLDGKSVVAATDDGAVQLVHLRQGSAGAASGVTGHKYVRTDAAVRGAHAAGEVTCVTFAPDGHRFATRGDGDGLLKIWDLRKLSDGALPLATLRGLACAGAAANCAWSPDGRLLVAGTAASSGGAGAGAPEARRDGGGRLYIFEAAQAEGAGEAGLGAGGAAYVVGVGEGAAAVCVLWSARLNQLVVGCGDGATRVLYDPALSTHGALLSTARAPRRRTVEDWAGSAAREASSGSIYAPNALRAEDAGPLWTSKSGRREEQAAKKAAFAARQPPKPSDVPAFLLKGRLTFTEHYLATHIGGNLRSEDPQKVLQQYAARSEAGSAGALFTSAYARTQPRTELTETTAEAEKDAALAAREARRPAGAGAGGGQ